MLIYIVRVGREFVWYTIVLHAAISIRFCSVRTSGMPIDHNVHIRQPLLRLNSGCACCKVA